MVKYPWEFRLEVSNWSKRDQFRAHKTCDNRYSICDTRSSYYFSARGSVLCVVKCFINKQI